MAQWKPVLTFVMALVLLWTTSTKSQNGDSVWGK